jgi:hypothetical protein
LLREEVTDDPGGDQRSEEATKSDNITNEDSRGTRKDYTLDRLAREDAELYERVVEGEMTPVQKVPLKSSGISQLIPDHLKKASSGVGRRLFEGFQINFVFPLFPALPILSRLSGDGLT